MKLWREKPPTYQLSHFDEPQGSTPDFRSKDAQYRSPRTPNSGLVPVSAVKNPGHCFVNRLCLVGMHMLMRLPDDDSNMLDCCGIPLLIPAFSALVGL
jgi:hypothetical protein